MPTNLSRRTFLRSSVAAVAVPLLPLTATAQHTTKPRVASLNVRSGPGTGYSIVGTVTDNDTLTVREIDATGQWYRIGIERWIYAWYTTDYREQMPPGAREK